MNVQTILPLAPIASLLGKNLGCPTCFSTLALGFWNFHWKSVDGWSMSETWRVSPPLTTKLCWSLCLLNWWVTGAAGALSATGIAKVCSGGSPPGRLTMTSVVSPAAAPENVTISLPPLNFWLTSLSWGAPPIIFQVWRPLSDALVMVTRRLSPVRICAVSAVYSSPASTLTGT